MSKNWRLSLVFVVICIFFSIANHANATFCIAHRGVHYKAVENSFAAIKLAFKTRVHGVEFDVRHTRDGKAIIMHDATLARTAKSKIGKTCPLEQDISTLTYDEIRKNCKLQSNEPVPTLERVLSYLSRKKIIAVIELKDIPNETTVDIINRYYAGKNSFARIISFSDSALDTFQKMVPSTSKNIRLLSLVSFSVNERYDGLDLHYLWFSPELVYKYRKMNKEIGFWTVDDASRIYEMKNYKIDLVTTNDPKLCMKIINN